MQAGGQRFDPVILHQDPQAETSVKQTCLTLAFEKSIATLFNKLEEGCVAALMRRWQHVVIASGLVSLPEREQHKYEFACSRLSRESTRL